jgi:hypothetical protein
MRLDLDVRRVWQCPACSRESRSEVQVVTKLCGCTKEGVAMRLVERPRPKPTVRIPQPSAPDSDIPELADFPTDIPVNPSGSPLVKRPPTEEPDTLLPQEPSERPQESPDSETPSTESE